MSGPWPEGWDCPNISSTPSPTLLSTIISTSTGIARIPTADIIDYDSRRGGFPSSWHTIGDTLDKIDKNTLAAVGRTVLAVVYQEK